MKIDIVIGSSLDRQIANAADAARTAERAFTTALEAAPLSRRADKQIISESLLSAFSLYAEASTHLRALVAARPYPSPGEASAPRS